MDKKRNKRQLKPEDDVYEKLKGKKDDDLLSGFDLDGEIKAIEASESSDIDAEDFESN